MTENKEVRDSNPRLKARWSDVGKEQRVKIKEILPREAHPRQMNFRKKDKRRNFRKRTETFSRSKSANASVLGNLFG